VETRKKTKLFEWLQGPFIMQVNDLFMQNKRKQKKKKSKVVMMVGPLVSAAILGFA